MAEIVKRVVDANLRREKYVQSLIPQLCQTVLTQCMQSLHELNPDYKYIGTRSRTQRPGP